MRPPRAGGMVHLAINVGIKSRLSENTSTSKLKSHTAETISAVPKMHAQKSTDRFPSLAEPC